MAKIYWEIVFSKIIKPRATRRSLAAYKNTRSIRSNQRRKHNMYKLGEKFSDIYFTIREADCMAHLLRGRSIKITADRLTLSPRTVEFYLKNMKKKLNCRTKYELIELVLQSDFLDNYKTK